MVYSFLHIGRFPWERDDSYEGEVFVVQVARVESMRNTRAFFVHLHNWLCANVEDFRMENGGQYVRTYSLPDPAEAAIFKLTFG